MISWYNDNDNDNNNTDSNNDNDDNNNNDNTNTNNNDTNTIYDAQTYPALNCSRRRLVLPSTVMHICIFWQCYSIWQRVCANVGYRMLIEIDINIRYVYRCYVFGLK